MEITIRLLKDWLNDGDEYKSGQLLKTDELTSQLLVKDGIAEIVTPDKKAVVVPQDEGAMTPEDIQKLVSDTIKENSKAKEKAFHDASEPDKKDLPWSGMGEFAQSVRAGKSDQKLGNYCKSTGMNIAINADGGFLVPEEFTTVLLTAMAAAGVIAPKCLNFPVNNNLKLPFVNITTQATSWTGGMTIYKPAEGVAKTASLPQIAKCELNLHKMTGVVYATDELLEDSPIALETFLTTMASTEFALTKDEDIINGSGAGEALGITNAPCKIAVDKVTGQAATTIESQNILDMYSRLYNPSRTKANWLISQDAMPEIAQLTVEGGTASTPVFIANVTDALRPTLLGLPIIWSPHCQTLGQEGDIILADFSQYVTITKQGQAMKTATSIHLKFLENETTFRFEIRCDGQPWWASAITPKHGDNTVSPFITLAVRE